MDVIRESDRIREIVHDQAQRREISFVDLCHEKNVEVSSFLRWVQEDHGAISQDELLSILDGLGLHIYINIESKRYGHRYIREVERAEPEEDDRPARWDE